MQLAVQLAPAIGTDGAQDFPAWIGHAADVAQLVGIAVAVPVALWAYRQLKSATASAEAQAVLALDQAFSLFEGFRKDLNQNAAKPTSDDVTLRRYLAVFERLGLLIKKDVIGVQVGRTSWSCGARCASRQSIGGCPTPTNPHERTQSTAQRPRRSPRFWIVWIGPAQSG
jgi:hypothetical protein